ncbi:cysteine desulfurase NifS [Celerinatantimonas sp. YJH-8]|uniref:cysteine desulfurase NifS n=1 Tax=Celerinatantimonas sp. YJH-8 TaxID=3228714 RepID=UPI0038C3CAB5
MQGIYLDNNATTRVDPVVLDTMLPYFSDLYGNPSSIHSFGFEVGKAMVNARRQVQSLLGAEYDSEIIFTSCGSESDNTAIRSALEAMPDRREIITSCVEHPAILELCDYLESQQGYTVHRLNVDEKGRIDLDQYQQLLSDRVAIVSIMWANNETGTIFPIEQMASMAKPFGCVFHTDAVQAVGKVPIKLAGSDIDMLSMSGHKIHAPKGIGVLYVRRGARYRPWLRGGHQERGRRAGTENTTSIIGLGKAAELAELHVDTMNTKIKALRDKLQAGILDQISHCFVTGDPEHRTANTLNIAFEYIEGEAILLMLNQFGIAASSGSACTSGSLEPSHVMRAMKIPQTAAHGSIRFSLSRYTREKDIDKVLEVIPGIIERLRSISPYWQQLQKGHVEGFTPAFG